MKMKADLKFELNGQLEEGTAKKAAQGNGVCKGWTEKNVRQQHTTEDLIMRTFCTYINY